MRRGRRWWKEEEEEKEKVISLSLVQLIGVLGMNGFARYGFAAEENRTPAISMDFQGLTPEFIAWIDQFDQKLEKVLKIRD